MNNNKDWQVKRDDANTMLTCLRIAEVWSGTECRLHETTGHNCHTGASSSSTS